MPYGVLKIHGRATVGASSTDLWELRSLAGEARELPGSYARVGFLANPLLLVLSRLSLLSLVPLGLVSPALAVFTLF